MHNSAAEELFLDLGDGELRLPRRRLGLYYQLTMLIIAGKQTLGQTQGATRRPYRCEGQSLAGLPTQGTGTQSCLVLPRTCKMQKLRFNVAELGETMVVIFWREV